MLVETILDRSKNARLKKVRTVFMPPKASEVVGVARSCDDDFNVLDEAAGRFHFEA
jgi:hypothetical protein